MGRSSERSEDVAKSTAVRSSKNEAVNTIYVSDEFQAGELEKLLAVGEAQAVRGQFVDGDQVFRRLKERSKAQRRILTRGTEVDLRNSLP